MFKTINGVIVKNTTKIYAITLEVPYPSYPKFLKISDVYSATGVITFKIDTFNVQFVQANIAIFVMNELTDADCEYLET